MIPHSIRMREHILATAPFDRMSDGTLNLLEEGGEWICLSAGEQLFAAGDPGDSMYVVAEGRLEVLIRDREGKEIVVAELGSHNIVGEISILTGGQRTATIRSQMPSQLIQFKRAFVDRLTETHPEAIAEINRLILHRLRRNQLAAILTSYFGSLPSGLIEEIGSLGEWVRLGRGEVLFRQGDPGDGFYVLVSGSLGVVVRDAEGRDKLINRIPNGELVGEMALLTDEARSATIYAIRDAELVRFPKEAFLLLIDKYPKFTLQIARLNINRLKQTAISDDRADTALIVSFIAASPEAPLGEFVRRLVEELSPLATTLHINGKRIDEILDMRGASQAISSSPMGIRFSAWLSDQEKKYRLILLEADPTETNWTGQCLRQSDQVITVGLSSSDPFLGPVESQLYNSNQRDDIRKRLILIHPDDCERPRGTLTWLACRAVEMHHHVRLGNREDIRRVARFLAGSAVCLALGGGGARGFAHIGAFRALQEAGVPIDIIGGTSMGAVIGAEMALGLPFAEAIERNRRIYTPSLLFLDLTLPLMSVTSGRNYARALREVFADVTIEDLWTPFFAVTSNISRATMAVHRTGLVWRTLRATTGIPGMVPPVVINGELHVDGCLFSNLPADVMKSVCRGKVIAIDVAPPVDLTENSDIQDDTSGWKILWQLLFSGRDRFHFLAFTSFIKRAMEASSIANQRQVIKNMADYYLLLPVEESANFDFGAIAELSEIGYRATKEKIAEWKIGAYSTASRPVQNTDPL
jgi:CRP-like cAMP-binding protein/predicted acylesterase/phospholipase RssA